jgi:hypothetical protein
MRADLADVVQEAARRLGGRYEWIVSGSAALLLRGVPVTPGDLDIWCTQEALVFFAERTHRDLKLFEDEWIVHSSFELQFRDWTVEVTGQSKIRRTGCVLEPDAEMFRRARSPLPVEALEDVLAEMLAMDRPAPKRDADRVFSVLSRPGHSLDLAYFRRRCLDWQVLPDLYRRAFETYVVAHSALPNS